MKAYELIDHPDKWSDKHCFADAQDNSCNPEVAVKFCPMGAIAVAYPFHGMKLGAMSDEGILAQLKLHANIPSAFITSWNSKAGWEHVYNKLKELDI